MYKCSSQADHGTLYQLQKLINRRNVKKDVTKAVTPCEEFLLLATEAHIVAAAMKLFNMSSLDATPDTTFFPQGSSDLDSAQRRSIYLLALKKLIVDLDLTFKELVVPHTQSKIDSVNEYACEVMSLGLFLSEFNDAIREGDGNRIVCCWRYMLLLFKSSHRTNYALEAFHLLAQLQYTMSPRKAMQLKWSRTVNVHGRPGRNIAGDLHMEHLNRYARELLLG